MKLDPLTLADKELPFEQILELIRDGKITDAEARFSIGTNGLHYDIFGEIDMVALLKSAYKNQL